MKKTKLLLYSLSIPVLIISIAFSTGSPGGKTGSPGDGGANCTECHSGTPNQVDGWIISDIPVQGYVPGQDYTITAIGNHPGVVRFGFELTSEDVSGAKVGTLTIADPLQTQYTNSQHAITHTINGITPAGNMKVWHMNWQAPPSNIGDITFYAAFNAADGSTTTTGDIIYLSSLTVNPTSPPALLSIEPDSAQQSSIVIATIIGNATSWQINTPDVSLTFHTNPNEIINATGITVISNSELEVIFNIPANASLGLWDLLVDVLVLEESFTITEAIPILIDIDPEIAHQLDNLMARITGEFTNFTSGVSSITLSHHENPSDVIVGTNIIIINDLVCQADFIISEDATTGWWDAHVDGLTLLKGIYIDYTIDIAEHDNKGIKVYPNPSSGLVNLEIVRESEILVYSSKGDLVYTSKAKGLMKIDLSEYGKGLYIIKIINPTDVMVEKVIIR